MKKISTVIMVLLLGTILVACGDIENMAGQSAPTVQEEAASAIGSTETEKSYMILSESDAEVLPFSDGSLSDLNVQKYTVPNQEGYYYELAGTDGDAVYYSKKEYVPMSTTVYSTQIVAVTDWQERPVLTVKDDSPHWVNEEKVIADGIVWVLFDSGKSCIQIYDSKNQETKTIKEFDDGKLVPIYDNKCAFVENEAGVKNICKYDLETNQYIERIETDIKNPNNCMTGGDWIVFSDGSYDGNRSLDIYGFNCAERSFCKLHSASEKHSIFSFHMIGGNLLFSDDQIDSAKLICRNLDTKTEYILADIPKGNFTFGWMYSNGFFVIEETKEHEIYVIHLGQ